MTLERAHEVSKALAEIGQSHTLMVGVHENMAPPVHARVELIFMGEQSIERLAGIADKLLDFDLTISWSSLTKNFVVDEAS